MAVKYKVGDRVKVLRSKRLIDMDDLLAQNPERLPKGQIVEITRIMNNAVMPYEVEAQGYKGFCCYKDDELESYYHDDSFVRLWQ